MKPLVYVAGPITANPWGCVRDGAAAWRWLRRAGCVPFIPQLSVLHEMVDPQPYEEWLAYDDDIIAHCHALVRLPGESKGADHEVDLANEIGLPVFVVEGMSPSNRPELGPVPIGAYRRNIYVDVAQWARQWTEAHGRLASGFLLDPATKGATP